MKEEELDSNDYYDAVADEYDNILLADDSNKIVRKKISQYVLGIQGINTIMDFGGGTGLDLTWMAEQFEVVFCEPCRKMRTKAEALVETSLTDARINILNDQDSNYLHWNDDLLNKIARPEAVLANFAVLNSISDLETMFEIGLLLLCWLRAVPS